MTVIKPGAPHHCRPEPGVIIKQYRNRLATYNESEVYLVDYEPGTTLICDDCGKVYVAEGWQDWCQHSALVHRETSSERKLREARK